MKCLVAVVGPTAVGKSALAMRLARAFNGEIINSDSRQVYRYMDIGTAKPPRADTHAVPHHLIDIIAPGEPYSLALYQGAALSAVEEVQSRNRLPLLTGGSGQYAWSVLENWSIPVVEPDRDFRKKIEERAQRDGTDSLYRELQAIDPVAAAKILPGNLRRICRALEIYEKTGTRPSELQARRGLPYPVLIIGLTTAREALYDAINRRTDRMMEDGLLEEVSGLLEMGYTAVLPSMSSLGYKQMLEHLAGKASLEDAVQAIKFATHRFARGQYAWFRFTDPRIEWHEAADASREKILYTVSSFLEKCGQNC
jgi:tRNA dimethylallyltransferase